MNKPRRRPKKRPFDLHEFLNHAEVTFARVVVFVSGILSVLYVFILETKHLVHDIFFTLRH